MKFRGHVQHGQVIADEPVPLKDGTPVSIEATETAAAQPPRGSAEAILGSDAHWHGDPTEIDRFLDELRCEKQAEVEAELRTWKESDSTE